MHKVLTFTFTLSVLLIFALGVSCSKGRGLPASGNDLARSTSNIGVFSFPHSPTFGQITEHGYYALSQGTTRCKVCHGANLTGGSTGGKKIPFTGRFSLWRLPRSQR
ncbi:MAG: hypothetical protein WCG27_08100, partial [Pseudomonadota bacterium]